MRSEHKRNFHYIISAWNKQLLFMSVFHHFTQFGLRFHIKNCHEVLTRERGWKYLRIFSRPFIAGGTMKNLLSQSKMNHMKQILIMIFIQANTFRARDDLNKWKGWIWGWENFHSGVQRKSMPYNNSFQLLSHRNHHQMNITISFLSLFSLLDDNFCSIFFGSSFIDMCCFRSISSSSSSSSSLSPPFLPAIGCRRQNFFSNAAP